MEVVLEWCLLVVKRMSASTLMTLVGTLRNNDYTLRQDVLRIHVAVPIGYRQHGFGLADE